MQTIIQEQGAGVTVSGYYTLRDGGLVFRAEVVDVATGDTETITPAASRSDQNHTSSARIRLRMLSPTRPTWPTDRIAAMEPRSPKNLRWMRSA